MLEPFRLSMFPREPASVRMAMVPFTAEPSFLLEKSASVKAGDLALPVPCFCRVPCDDERGRVGGRGWRGAGRSGLGWKTPPRRILSNSLST